MEKHKHYTLMSAKPLPRTDLKKPLGQHTHPWEVLNAEAITIKPFNVNQLSPLHSHRVGGPVEITEKGQTVWLRHGIKHREGGPAVLTEDGTQEWWTHGALHNPNVNEPTEIHKDGTKIWFWHGYLSRVDGPAIKRSDGTEEWWFNSLLHNFNGPAKTHGTTMDIVTPKGETVTFHDQWSVYGIPTRFPELCEKITLNTFTTEKLVELSTHEDYVVFQLAKYHSPQKTHTWGTFNNENFFKLFTTPQDAKNIITDLLPERVSFVVQTKTLFEKDTIVAETSSSTWEHNNLTSGVRKKHTTFVNCLPHSVSDKPSTFFSQDNIMVGNQFWHKNGQLHRTSGPAVKNPNVNEEWWAQGKLHNVEGPAIRRKNGTKEWWLQGELHRLDGPAVEKTSPNENEWWVNDIFTTQNGICEKITSSELRREDLEKYSRHEDYVIREIAKEYLKNEHTLKGQHLNENSHKEFGEEKIATLQIAEIESAGDGWVPIKLGDKKLHNLNGPAVKHTNGDQEWWAYGELKRRNGGPTVERADGTQEWWVGHYDDVTAPITREPYLHRVDGPAIQHPKEVQHSTRYVWWYEGETTNLSDLCERAANRCTPQDELYELSMHKDYVVRKIALANPQCPEEGKIFEQLSNETHHPLT